MQLVGARVGERTIWNSISTLPSWTLLCCEDNRLGGLGGKPP